MTELNAEKQNEFISDLMSADMAIRLAKSSPDKITNWDMPFLNFLSKELGNAEHESKSKIRDMIGAHRETFPLSPLFSDCTLLYPLGLCRKETAVTQALAWLLSPSENHGLGNSLLCAFIQAIPETDEKKAQLLRKVNSRVNVQSEYAIKDVGRVDVVVYGDDWVIVVEAKVDASEGKDQTVRYAKWYENERYEPTFVYLTLDGARPNSDQFLLVSYRQLAKQFIAALRICTSAPGFGYARLFTAGLLRDFCDIRPSGNIETIIRSNSFELEQLLSQEIFIERK